MSHHLVAYTELLGTTANTDIDALADSIFAISNAHFLPQRDYDLIFAIAMSATLNRARLVSPHNQQITLPFLLPIMAAVEATNPPQVADYRDNPFRIYGGEELAVEATSDIAMGTERFTALLGLQDVFITPPRGNVFSIRGTSATAAVANAWSLITMTWANLIPSGQYSCVGVRHVSTGGQACRLIFENQVIRPGCLSQDAAGDMTHPMFLKGGLGELGRFSATRMPNVEVLCNSADTDHVVFLDIIKVG